MKRVYRLENHNQSVYYVYGEWETAKTGESTIQGRYVCHKIFGEIERIRCLEKIPYKFLREDYIVEETSHEDLTECLNMTNPFDIPHKPVTVPT